MPRTGSSALTWSEFQLKKRRKFFFSEQRLSLKLSLQLEILLLIFSGNTVLEGNSGFSVLLQSTL